MLHLKVKVKLKAKLLLISSVPPGGPLRYIIVHMHEQKNKEKGVFFSQERVKQGTRLGV